MQHRFVPCFRAFVLAIACAIVPLAGHGQAGLGGLDADSVRSNRPQRVANVTHPSGAPVWHFQLPGGACRNPDCRNDRERSELIQSTPDNHAGRAYRYTFSVYLRPDMPSVSPTNLTVWQIKPHGSGKPSLSIEVQHNEVFAILSDPSRVQGDPMNPLQPAVIRRVTSQARGHWLDFVLDARWSRGADGFLRLALDGREVLRHSGPNIDSNSERQRVRFGLYRSFLSRYKQRTGAAALPTQTALFSNVTRASLR